MKSEYIKTWLLIIAVTILTIIVIFYSCEKNLSVQPYLHDIQTKTNKIELNNEIVNLKSNYKKENDIIVVNNFLNNSYFNFIKNQFEGEQFSSRNFLLRKAGGINFFKLHQSKYEGLLEIYYSNNVLTKLSNIIGKPIQRISLSDPNACSLLIYANEGDYIDWHYDYSSYYGDRYVVLLTIINENKDKTGLSDNKFIYKYDGKNNKLKMDENSLIIFKGSEILHQSTSIKKGEKRILLSMVYCDICQEKKNVFNQIYEKSKNFIVYN